MLFMCSQKDVQQLKSILLVPSLNPDIRRAAAEQLLSLVADQRFAQALSDAALLHAIHQTLASTCGVESISSEAEQGAADSHAQMAPQQQQADMPNMQLPIACLQLLVGIMQHCSEAKSLLLQEADRCGCTLLDADSLKHKSV